MTFKLSLTFSIDIFCHVLNTFPDREEPLVKRHESKRLVQTFTISPAVYNYYFFDDLSSHLSFDRFDFRRSG